MLKLRSLFKRRRRKVRTRTKSERVHYELHKEAARTLVHERIAYWCTFIQVTPLRITIRDTRSRWGSCSTKGNLNFNYRLVLIPIEIADYVIVHELCHLLEFNHSPRFWEKVAQVMPDYALRKRALHEYSKQPFIALPHHAYTLPPLTAEPASVS